MSKRADLRALYIEGWDTRNLELLLASTAEDFVFDDPTDPAPVTKAELAGYLPVWFDKAKSLGTTFSFEMTDKVVQDRDGILLEWYWWRLANSPVEGSAVIKTSDDGVVFERLTYFRSPWPLRA